MPRRTSCGCTSSRCFKTRRSGSRPAPIKLEERSSRWGSSATPAMGERRSGDPLPPRRREDVDGDPAAPRHLLCLGQAAGDRFGHVVQQRDRRGTGGRQGSLGGWRRGDDRLREAPGHIMERIEQWRMGRGLDELAQLYSLIRKMGLNLSRPSQPSRWAPKALSASHRHGARSRAAGYGMAQRSDAAAGAEWKALKLTVRPRHRLVSSAVVKATTTIMITAMPRSSASSRRVR